MIREQNAHRRTGKLGKAPGIAAVWLVYLLTIRVLVMWAAAPVRIGLGLGIVDRGTSHRYNASRCIKV